MTLTAGYPVLHFARIDSTNSEARRRAEAGERGPIWLVADRQDGGRGRLGRRWVSEPGNLYATLLYPLDGGSAAAPQAALVAAVAVRAALLRLCPDLQLGIKWPNDLLAGGAKLCGILAEVVGHSPTRLAIGCGINIAHAPGGMAYPVAALGNRVTVQAVFQELDSSLSNYLKIWDEGRGFAAIRASWEAAALGLGAPVAAERAGRLLQGRFAGLAADGALLLEEADGTRHTIHSGDVRFADVETLRRA